jgi:Phage terminase, small subunit
VPERYVTHLTRWRDCERAIAERGLTTAGAGGRLVVQPVVREAHRLNETLAKAVAALGLNPAGGCGWRCPRTPGRA